MKLLSLLERIDEYPTGMLYAETDELGNVKPTSESYILVGDEEQQERIISYLPEDLYAIDTVEALKGYLEDVDNNELALISILNEVLSEDEQ